MQELCAKEGPEAEINIYLLRNQKVACVSGWQRVRWRVAQDEAAVVSGDYVAGIKDLGI